jgi:hypothetical protein
MFAALEEAAKEVNPAALTARVKAMVVESFIKFLRQSM